jgi:hypothetical protein
MLVPRKEGMMNALVFFSTIRSTGTLNASPKPSPTSWLNSEKHGQSGWIQDSPSSCRE